MQIINTRVGIEAVISNLTFAGFSCYPVYAERRDFIRSRELAGLGFLTEGFGGGIDGYIDLRSPEVVGFLRDHGSEITLSGFDLHGVGLALRQVGIYFNRGYDSLHGFQLLTAGLNRSSYLLEDLWRRYGLHSRVEAIPVLGEGESGLSVASRAAANAVELRKLLLLVESEIKREGLLPTWTTEACALPAFVEMERVGVAIDVEQLAAIQKSNLEVVTSTSADLRKLLGVTTDLNIGSPQQINPLVSSLPADQQDAARTLLARYRSAKAMLDRYDAVFMSASEKSGDGRIHFKSRQIGTETGRPSGYDGLNAYNIPSDIRYRRAITAGSDMKMSAVDWSAIELRILARESNDVALTGVFLMGEDPHSRMASEIFKTRVTRMEKPDLREAVKQINYGIPYGMTAAGLRHVLSSVGLNWSQEQVRYLHETHRARYSEAHRWLETQAAVATESLKLQTRTGRLRRWTSPPTTDEEKKRMRNEAMNFGMQAICADIMKSALGNVVRRGRGFAWPILAPYDEIVTVCFADFADSWHQQHRHLMTSAANQVLHPLPSEVEGFVGDTWGG